MTISIRSKALALLGITGLATAIHAQPVQLRVTIQKFALMNVKAGQRSHVAWNSNALPALVAFSDEFTLYAAPHSLTCAYLSSFNDDGFITSEDFDTFVTAFGAGC